jgi:hypothetical protein
MTNGSRSSGTRGCTCIAARLAGASTMLTITKLRAHIKAPAGELRDRRQPNLRGLGVPWSASCVGCAPGRPIRTSSLALTTSTPPSRAALLTLSQGGSPSPPGLWRALRLRWLRASASGSDHPFTERAPTWSGSAVSTAVTLGWKLPEVERERHCQRRVAHLRTPAHRNACAVTDARSPVSLSATGRRVAQRAARS